MKNRSKTVALLGISAALALILAYVEILLQPLVPTIPGIKMGLPNIVIIFLLYRRGECCAAIVSFLRIILVGMLFGNALAMIYSMAGAVLSLLTMMFLRRLNLFSVVGASVAGSVAHNVGQILMAIFLIGVAELGYYLIVLALTGCLFGAFIGALGALLVRRVPRLPFERDLP